MKTRDPYPLKPQPVALPAGFTGTGTGTGGDTRGLPVPFTTYAGFSRRPDVPNLAKDPVLLHFLSVWLQTLMWQRCPWWVCVYIALLLHTSPHSLCNYYAQYIIIKPYPSVDEMKPRLQSEVDIQYCNFFCYIKK